MTGRAFFHFVWLLLVRSLFVAFALCALILALDWMENVKYLRDANFSDVFRYYLLRMPNLVDTALLPGVAMGSALGIHQVGRRLELVAWRAAGISRTRLLLPPALCAGLILALGQAGLRSGVLPNTRPEADILADRLGVADPGLRLFLMQRHWIATQNGFLRVGAARGKNKIKDVLMVELDDRFSPKRVVEAKEGVFTGLNKNGLLLKEARVVRFSSQKQDLGLQDCLDRFRKSTDARDAGLWRCLEEDPPPGLVEEHLETLEIPVDPGVRRLALLVGHPGGFATSDLWTLVQTGAEKGHDLSSFAAEFRRRISGPLWLMLALLLAALAAASDNHKAGIEIPLLVTAVVSTLAFVGQTLQDQVAPLAGSGLWAIGVGLGVGLLGALALIRLRHRH
jgi:lipopolysaccharide export LptBFGC system permease protein LptF